MYVGQLTIAQHRCSDEEATSHAINCLLYALQRNGQICGSEYPIAVTPEGYVVTVLLPEKTALEVSHRNRYVISALENLAQVGLEEPRCTVAPDLDGAGACECGHPQSFLLYTSYKSLESPLRCGTCFLPVPLYRVPPTRDEEYYDVISWRFDYQACDTLHMNSTTLERAATRQMLLLDSSLSQAGLAICGRIFESTRIPTYYYLYRYGARSRRQELKRRCPSCGGEWLLPSAWWELFDFKCDRCHLLSNIALTVQEPGLS